MHSADWSPWAWVILAAVAAVPLVRFGFFLYPLTFRLLYLPMAAKRHGWITKLPQHHTILDEEAPLLSVPSATTEVFGGPPTFHLAEFFSKNTEWEVTADGKHWTTKISSSCLLTVPLNTGEHFSDQQCRERVVRWAIANLHDPRSPLIRYREVHRSEEFASISFAGRATPGKLRRNLRLLNDSLTEDPPT